MHCRGFEPIKEMKVLHKGICKDVVLVTLIYEEVGQSDISNKLRELLVESGFVHEGIVWPYARLDLRPMLNVEVAVRGVPKDSLGIPLRGTPPKEIHFLYEQFLKFLDHKKMLTKLHQIDSN